MLAHIGIIGCGAAATRLHLPALARIPGVSLVAASDSDAARLAAAGDQFGIRRRYGDYVGLLADLDVQVVAIATPPATHAAIGVEALEAGKHILIEKPLALTLADADRLLDAARANAHLIAAVGFNLRCHPLLIAAKSALKTIGAHTITSVFTTPGGADGWRQQADSGADALFDLGSHHLDLWRWLTDDAIDSVRATSGADGVTVTAQLAGGVRASGRFQIGTIDAHQFEIVGSRGKITIEPYRLNGLRIRRNVLSPVIDTFHLARGLITTPDRNIFARSYTGQWESLLRRTPAATLADGRAALAAVLAAGESLRTGMEVSL